MLSSLLVVRLSSGLFFLLLFYFCYFWGSCWLPCSCYLINLFVFSLSFKEFPLSIFTSRNKRRINVLDILNSTTYSCLINGKISNSHNNIVVWAKFALNDCLKHMQVHQIFDCSQICLDQMHAWTFLVSNSWFLYHEKQGTYCDAYNWSTQVSLSCILQIINGLPQFHLLEIIAKQHKKHNLFLMFRSKSLRIWMLSWLDLSVF